MCWVVYNGALSPLRIPWRWFPIAVVTNTTSPILRSGTSATGFVAGLLPHCGEEFEIDAWNSCRRQKRTATQQKCAVFHALSDSTDLPSPLNTSHSMKVAFFSQPPDAGFTQPFQTNTWAIVYTHPATFKRRKNEKSDTKKISGAVQNRSPKMGAIKADSNFVFYLCVNLASAMARGSEKSQVRQCLGFCTADSYAK